MDSLCCHATPFYAVEQAFTRGDGSLRVDDVFALSCLKRFGITEIKIYKRFGGQLAVGTNDTAIVRGTIALADGLGMTVVAERGHTEARLACFLRGIVAMSRRALFTPSLRADGAGQ
ncbi:hypothetical protein ACCAA_370028 [Candidatus Accumulibacter aalborgensis]|uniref:Uncharacterized protein n=1 Tax=Candidatus Accumulibacter aalborgensis TaxID=1860102 RepID=A0A1A8XP51_9PROT|nr:hypothetical protein ACCAA_370028 [Candidatus Accumulibacter aalborgensis]